MPCGHGRYFGANMQPPAIDSLLGKNVRAVVLPWVNLGYLGQSELTLRDDKGLVLSVYWDMGGMPRSKSFDDVGISVSPATAICDDSCRVACRIRFAGTSDVELAPGEQGTFQVGSATYSAYAIGCADQSSNARCADGYPYRSWAVFRSDL